MQNADPVNLHELRPTRTGALAAGDQRNSDSLSSNCVQFHKPDEELWRALRWAEGIHWFPTVGELDLLRAEYRLAKARAA